MRIAKVINNNVISVVNEKKQELVIMGRGIAFQKKAGDLVDEERIEKIFTLESKDVSERFKKLLYEIPMEYMEVSEEIIQYAKITFGKKLNESIYVSLTDHIYFAVDRHKKGMDIKNGLLWETKRIYKDEFSIGKEALKMIEKKLGATLPEDEAAFIAMHIVNAELNVEIPTIINITKVMQEILNIVKYHFKIEFDEESLHYYRFITHLKFFAQRVFHGSVIDSNSNDDFLYKMVKSKYAAAYQCTQKITNFIQKEYHYKLTNEEMMYLTIHIQRVTHQM
jgi:beta-glucoside operon transcriptional antiterminator